MSEKPERQRIVEEAIEWMVRLQSGDFSAAEGDALERWKALSSEHAEVFRQLLDSLAPLQDSPWRGQPSATVLRALEQPSSRRRFVGGALGLFVLLAGGAGLERWVQAGMGLPGELATGTGERRDWLLADGSRLRLADGRWLSAEALVLANGIHAGELCAELPIRPKKGHLLITDRYPGTLRHQLVELGYVSSAHASSGTSVAFNAQPRPTGQVFLGSSRQFDTLDPQVEGPVLARMLRRALDYLPGLAGLNAIRAWTGFRAATPDGLPLLGEHPAQPGLWLAVGHEGLGVTTAPGSARLLAAQLFGETPPLDATPYLPQRFLSSSGSARP